MDLNINLCLNVEWGKVEVICYTLICVFGIKFKERASDFMIWPQPPCIPKLRYSQILSETLNTSAIKIISKEEVWSNNDRNRWVGRMIGEKQEAWRFHRTEAAQPICLFFFLKIYWLIDCYVGLRFCARTFSSCGKRGPLFIAVRGPLTIAASLVAEHRLQTRRLSSCGSWV